MTKVGNIATAEIPIFMPPGGYPNAASQKCYCPFRVVAKQNLDGIGMLRSLKSEVIIIIRVLIYRRLLRRIKMEG